LYKMRGSCFFHVCLVFFRVESMAGKMINANLRQDHA